MTDQYATLLPQSVLRSLSDKMYEKRKTAALEVEAVVKQFANSGDHDKISGIIELLIKEFALSPQSNHRKGGLIGLAAATVGLSSEAAQHLEKIVPPVLQSFSDQDSRVRYYACEALYNIAKVSRGDFIIFFNDVFESLMKLSADVDPNVQNAAHLLDRLVKDIVTESDQFSIEEFIPVLRERMNVINPFVRQFLVGWITVLDSVPDIDMLGFLPDFLDGLFNMLGDTNPEIKVQADSALKEFLQEIKNSSSVDFGRMTEILVIRANSSEEFQRLTAITWLNEFVKLGGTQLIPYYADILEAVLSCISDEHESVREVAKETNYEQVKRIDSMSLMEGFKLNDVLNLTHRLLNSQSETTRIESLRWISLLLGCFRNEVLNYLDSENASLFDKLAQMLSDPSDEALLLVLQIEASVAREENHFKHFIALLINRFNKNRSSLLEKRGSLIFRQICLLLEPEKIYREMAKSLEAETDLDFATVMVQALNLILLTVPELSKLRQKVKMTLSNPEGKNFFFSIYGSWAHSPMAVISLCFLAQAYEHACSIISCLEEGHINVNFLIQIDKFVHLLETPVFAFLRLQLLEPRKYPFLLKALYGLLMILPQQSIAWKILRTRLKSVPVYAFLHISSNFSSSPAAVIHESPSSPQPFFACENSFSTPNSPTSQESAEVLKFESREQSSSGLGGSGKVEINGLTSESLSSSQHPSASESLSEDMLSEFFNAMQVFQSLQKRHIHFHESILQPLQKFGRDSQHNKQHEEEFSKQKDIYPDYVEK